MVSTASTLETWWFCDMIVDTHIDRCLRKVHFPTNLICIYWFQRKNRIGCKYCMYNDGELSFSRDDDITLHLIRIGQSDGLIHKPSDWLICSQWTEHISLLEQLYAAIFTNGVRTMSKDVTDWRHFGTVWGLRLGFRMRVRIGFRVGVLPFVVMVNHRVRG